MFYLAVSVNIIVFAMYLAATVYTAVKTRFNIDKAAALSIIVYNLSFLVRAINLAIPLVKYKEDPEG